MTRVIWAESAKDDYHAILRYIADTVLTIFRVIHASRD